MYEPTAQDNDLTGAIIESAIHVHKSMGPGLLERVYEECLYFDLQGRGFNILRQVPVPVSFDGHALEPGFMRKRRIVDLIVDDHVIVELKAIEKLQPIHEAQLHTYLKLSGKRMGLLINFNVPLLKQGIKRIIMGK